VTKTEFVQARDSNLDHMTRFKGRWERSAQKACSLLKEGGRKCAFMRWIGDVSW
jgi:hypothetical protein